MTKKDLLLKLDLQDPFEGFNPLSDSKLWGWNGATDIFAQLIEQTQPKIVIEVGSWLGLSTYTMSNALRESGKTSSCIIAIDTWLGSKEHWEDAEGRQHLEFQNGFPNLYRRFMSNMKIHGCESNIFPLPLPSLIAARYLEDHKIHADLIYIDGSHDTKDVYDDLCAYWELLNENGIIFGDDFLWESVATAVEKFQTEKKVSVEVIGVNWVIQKTATPDSKMESASVFKTASHRQIYKEPELTFLVLDYQKESETRKCLESIKTYVKFEHKVIYLHNGFNDGYPYQLFKEGLIDQFVETKQNNGLGIGTRDLFASSFSPYTFYLQNDQFITRDFTQAEFDSLKKIIGSQFTSPEDGSVWTAASVDVAGAVCGLHIYSERGHIIQTDFYKMMEEKLPLQPYGAGPYHDGPWREELIQNYYKINKYLHFTYENRFVEDNGYHAIRENTDGSVWEQRNDTKELRLLHGPVKERFIYPNFTNAEWEEVIRTQAWPEWKIPEKDVHISYHQWN